MTVSSVLKNISFEFYPPQAEEGLTKLCDTAKQLQSFSPEFFSVTFGAGGSTQERTINTVNQLLKEGYEVAPHLSCVGMTKAKIMLLLEDYQKKNIKHLVALRGDFPSGIGSHAGEFCYAEELVSFIRDKTGDHFHVEVAAYPECHPESIHLKSELDYFKKKVDAGANGAITQYFYNADAYYHFLNECEKLNISLPIIPGIMPITNYVQLSRFSKMCGAEIPRWLQKSLERFADDVESIRAIGLEFMTSFCEKLLSYGAPGLHFYTLNQASATQAILLALSRNGI